MSTTLLGLNVTPRSDTLNALGAVSVPTVASVGAGVANTTVQSSHGLPFNYKIRKISVLYSAASAVTGTIKFNLVIGGFTGGTGQTYTQGNIGTNDNSYSMPAGGTVGSANLGYCTNVAVAGMSIFGADVPINSANLQSANTTGIAGNQTGQNTGGTGWIVVTTTGGYGIFVPTNNDVVYPQGVPLTLRLITPASTGSLTNFSIDLMVEPVRLRTQPPIGEGAAVGAGQSSVGVGPSIVPGLDY